MKNIVVLKLMMVFSLVFHMGSLLKSAETEKLKSFTGVLYEPIFDFVRKASEENKKKWGDSPDLDFKITFSSFSGDETEIKYYDQFRAMRYEVWPDVVYKLYLRGDVLMRVVRRDLVNGSIETFERDMDFINRDLDSYPQEYMDKSREALLPLLTKEDVITKLPAGENIVTVQMLMINPNKCSAKLFFPSLSLHHVFSVQPNRFVLNSSWGSFDAKQIDLRYFMSADRKNRIRRGDWFDRPKNGYRCEFFPHGGLQCYSEMRNGEWQKVTTWKSSNGEVEKVEAFKEWRQRTVDEARKIR